MRWILFQTVVAAGVGCVIIYLNGGKNDFGYAPAAVGIAAAYGLTLLIGKWIDRSRGRS